MDFWLQRQGQGWQAIGHAEAIPAGVYTIIVQSPQPHFTLPVHCRHFPPESSPSRQTQPLQSWDTTIRTNEEGIAVLAHAQYLEPGWWEWCCRDGDLIAELFGDPQNDTLIVQVIPAPEPLPAPPSPPNSESPPEQIPRAASTPESMPESPLEALPPTEVEFTLMRQELAASPGSKVIVAGRTSSAGEIIMQLHSYEGVLISQGRQTVKMWGEGKSVAFSISLVVPDHPWTQPLQGEAELYQGSRCLSRQSFRVCCQAEPPSPLMTLRPKLWQEDELVPGFPPEPTPPLSWLDEKSERTVQKLLRLSQLAPIPSEPNPPAPLTEPSACSLPSPSPAANPGDPPFTLTLPDPLISQQVVEILITLSPGAPPHCYIQLSVFHGQTRECLDGPRYLLDWRTDAQGSRFTTTRMTIPTLKTELVWVATLIDPETNSHSQPLQVSRLIRR